MSLSSSKKKSRRSKVVPLFQGTYKHNINKLEYTKLSATQLEATKEIPARTENLVYERGMVEDRVALILKEIL